MLRMMSSLMKEVTTNNQSTLGLTRSLIRAYAYLINSNRCLCICIRVSGVLYSLKDAASQCLDSVSVSVAWRWVILFTSEWCVCVWPLSSLTCVCVCVPLYCKTLFNLFLSAALREVRCADGDQDHRARQESQVSLTSFRWSSMYSISWTLPSVQWDGVCQMKCSLNLFKLVCTSVEWPVLY